MSQVTTSQVKQTSPEESCCSDTSKFAKIYPFHYDYCKLLCISLSLQPLSTFKGW